MLSREEQEEFKKRLAELKLKEDLTRRKINHTPDNLNSDPDRSKAMKYSFLGVEFIAIFLLFLFGGKFADEKLGSSPWLFLVGCIAGFAISFYRLIKSANAISK
jgi:F0F1-type ATP synthase assembly protein I